LQPAASEFKDADGIGFGYDNLIVTSVWCINNVGAKEKEAVEQCSRLITLNDVNSKIINAVIRLKIVR
jgi:hypothetical protein